MDIDSPVTTLLGAFWRICCLRLRPQDVPRSSVLLSLTVGTNTLLSTLINQVSNPLTAALRMAVLEMLVLLGLTSALLYAFSRTPRIAQTVTALMGTGALIGGLVFLGMVLIPALPQALHLAIFLWNLLVIAHVLRHALDTRFIVGMLLAIGYAFFLTQLELFVNNLVGGAPT